MEEIDTFKQFHDEHGFVVLAANRPLAIGSIIGAQCNITTRAPGTGFHAGSVPLPLRVIEPSSREEHIAYEKALGFRDHALPAGYDFFFRAEAAD